MPSAGILKTNNMKTSHIVIGVLATIIVIFLVLIYKTHRDKKDNEGFNRLKNDAALSLTTTTMVHPLTGEEVVISPNGSSSMDSGFGEKMTKSTISKIIDEVIKATKQAPSQITLKTYSKTGQLLSTTTVNNPEQMNMPVATPAETKSVNGAINYSCSKEQELGGPGYYSDYSGTTLFGMFCN